MKKYLPILFFSLFTFSYALPFQAPVAGDYSCVSSEKSIFDANAQDIGATLTIAADGSYTFTTSNASENGSVTVSEDTSADLANYFQSGSILKLQPSSGSAPYEAMFVVDKQNGMYIMLRNNNGLSIRCESPGANIANAMQQIATEQAQTTQPTNTPETPDSSTSKSLILEPGSYQCFSSPTNPLDKNAQDMGTTLTLSADGSYTFTGSTSENGSVEVIEDDTNTEFADLFQSSKGLVLQPGSGSALYIGVFVTDNQGGMYFILQNANNKGLWIRCDSPGADIANAIEQIVAEQAATEQAPTQPTNTPERSSTSTPLTSGGSIESGIYSCSYTYDYIDNDYNETERYQEKFYALFVYDDHSTLVLAFTGSHYSYLENPHGHGSYEIDATNNVMFKDGWFDGLVLSYGKNAEGNTELFYTETFPDDYGEWVTNWTCTYDEPLIAPEFYGLDETQLLTPVQAVEPGAYACTYTDGTMFFTWSDDPSYYPDEEVDSYSLFLFPDGTTLTSYLGLIQKYSDGTESMSERNAGYLSEYALGSYTFDVSTGQITLRGGHLGGRMYLYGTNAEGKTALFRLVSTLEVDGTEKTWDNTYTCTRSSDIPAGLMDLADSTPVVDLTNVIIAPSKFDATNPNPNKIPMIDTYYCYPSFSSLERFAETYDDYLNESSGNIPRYVREHVLEILPNNQYTFDGETGTFATNIDGSYFQFQSGPLNPTGDLAKGADDYSPPHSASVDYTHWGAEITDVKAPVGTENGYRTVNCWQQGAREQWALLDVALRFPTPGNYQCQTAGDNPEQKTLEILPDNRYLYDGQEGSYWIKASNQGNQIMWEFGPLWGDRSYYSSDDSTGLRSLEVAYEASVGSGISVSFYEEQLLYCEALAPANLIPEYGTAAATPPPAGSGGLDAVYARSEYNSDDLSTTWFIYHFLANGYGGERLITEEECSKTYPNGQNVCGTYTAQGNTVTFGNGEQIALQSADSGNGDVIIEGQLYENKTLSGPLTLSGTFETGSASSSSPITNMASTYISESAYTFSQDGTFSYYRSSQSTMAAPSMLDATGVGALGTSSSFESSSGTYTINGNTITFQHDKGYTTQCGFFFPRNNDASSVHVCGTDYDLASGE